MGRNRLTTVPSSFSNLTKLKVLSLVGNNLTIPLEVLNGSIDALLNYLTEIGEGELFNLREAKLLIVGEGNVGKTELSRAIVCANQASLPQSTEGIEVTRWVTKKQKIDYTINIWDFGGQEIYHATHQYFLTKKSVYLFVWTARTDDDFNAFDYWLNIINLLSDSSPVLIVQNKCDERTKEIDTTHISRQFLNVAGFFDTSATVHSGIDDLCSSIIKSVEKLDHFNQVVPIAWIRIRRHLEETKRPYIDFGEYLSICAKYGLNTEKAEWLSEYYHVLGVFLHFSDNMVLSNIILLKPEWATSASYKLFDDEEVIDNSGSFNKTTLRRVWADYPLEKHPVLLELMKRFELCFQIANTNNYIVPSKLPAARPPKLASPRSELTYYYQYDFMPAGIVERCIVRLHQLIDKENYWKNGVKLIRGDASALVESNRFKRRITICLEGGSRAELLTIIRNEMDVIHSSLNSPHVTENLPCVCTECSKEEPYYYNILELERARSKRRKTIECRKSFEAVEINVIFGGVDGSLASKEEEILSLLRKLVDQYDTRETLAQKINSSFCLQPNVFGIGVNLNKLIDKVLAKNKKA